MHYFSKPSLLSYLSTDTESLVYQGDEKQAGELQVEETKTEEVEEEGKQSENVIQETFQGTQEQGKGGDKGGVLGTIGETIGEIAQQTKQLVIGQPRTGAEQEGEAYESGPAVYGREQENRKEEE